MALPKNKSWKTIYEVGDWMISYHEIAQEYYIEHCHQNTKFYTVYNKTGIFAVEQNTGVCYNCNTTAPEELMRMKRWLRI